MMGLRCERMLTEREGESSALRHLLQQTVIPALQVLAAGESALILAPDGALPIAGRRQDDLETHQYPEICFCLSGEAELWTGEGYVRLGCGGVLVIPPGVPHSPGELHSITGNPRHAASRLLWLGSFPYGAVMNLCECEARQHHSTTRHLFLERRCGTLIAEVIQELRSRRSGYAPMAAAVLVQALVGISRGSDLADGEAALAAPQPALDEGETLCARARRFIRDRFDTPLDLDIVARALMTNRSALCREFKQGTGRTVLDYLTAVRIDAARRLLLTSLKVAEVSRLVGVNDPYYFSRLFRRHCGCSPKDFRQQQHAAAEDGK